MHFPSRVNLDRVEIKSGRLIFYFDNGSYAQAKSLPVISTHTQKAIKYYVEHEKKLHCMLDECPGGHELNINNVYSITVGAIMDFPLTDLRAITMKPDPFDSEKNIWLFQYADKTVALPLDPYVDEDLVERVLKDIGGLRARFDDPGNQRNLRFEDGSHIYARVKESCFSEYTEHLKKLEEENVVRVKTDESIYQVW